MDCVTSINNLIVEQTLYSKIHSIQEANNKTFNDKRLTVKLADVEDFVKKNEVKEITNPIFFIKDGVPSPDGLLSNEIFGITKEERANIWGYIDLRGWFLHPLCYKIWSRMDKHIVALVHGTKNFKIDSSGYLVEDENGKTGLKFLHDNIDKIKFKRTDSSKRDTNIEFLMKNKDRMFIKKMLVQPPFYRDVLSGKGKVEVGALNKYYASLLISAKSLQETQDMGFSLGDATKGRIQETILNIYKCVSGTSSNPDDGRGLSGKFGIINASALAKTADYGTRLILSAPELKVESLDDLMVDIEHCALPLASAIVNFKPFVVFAIKRFFDNEFGGGTGMKVVNSKGQVEYAEVENYQSVFSDANIEKEIARFIHGYSNRFQPVQVPIKDKSGKTKTAYMVFKGRNISADDYAAGKTEGESSLIDRRLTWCDVLYMGACEAVKDKAVLITRFPIDSAYNQFPAKVRISTTKDVEPVMVNSEFYRWYPKIREEDIGSNTSNTFIDTLNICNLMLKGIGGDYDGDSVSIKGCWLQESNAECDKYIKSKSNYINFSGTNIRQPSNEAIQSLYSLTKILTADEGKLTNPKF